LQRVTQIKDWKGIRNSSQQLTGNDIIDAINNYVKTTGEDNNMTDMFEAIMDPYTFARFFSPFAKIVAPVGIATGLSVPELHSDKKTK